MGFIIDERKLDAVLARDLEETTDLSRLDDTNEIDEFLTEAINALDREDTPLVCPEPFTHDNVVVEALDRGERILVTLSFPEIRCYQLASPVCTYRDVVSESATAEKQRAEALDWVIEELDLLEERARVIMGDTLAERIGLYVLRCADGLVTMDQRERFYEALTRSTLDELASLVAEGVRSREPRP